MSGYDNQGFAGDGTYGNHNEYPGTETNKNQLARHSKDNGFFTVELNDRKKSLEAGEYDPYRWRDVEHPTTDTETFLHLLKGSLGTGILAMPMAFYHSGYLLGAVGTAIIGFLCTHCIHLLIRAEYELCKRRKVAVMSYPETALAGFQEGPPFQRRIAFIAPHMVNIFLLIYQLGSGAVYTIFIGDNISGVFAAHGITVNVKLVMLAALLPLILINCVKNLKYLAPLSTFANIITMVSFGIIAYYMFSRDFTFDGKEPFGEVKNYPLFFGTVLFALEAIGVIMPLENEMKTPQNFGSPFGVLNKGMVVITILYTSMGFFGYIAYGSSVQGSISLSIGDDIPGQICRILLSMSIYVTHGLQLYPAIKTVWDIYLLPLLTGSNHLVLLEYVTRVFLVTFCFVLAVAVPYIDLFISLFGALTLSGLGLFIPAMVDMGTYWHQRTGKTRIFTMIKNCLIILLGFFGLIVGTSTSLNEIINKFSNE
uniref:Proton-coupled amino acid transporter-like protein CG1139 n=1 Tax=Diabrotica virgifera virgifera TaxID=50390 RepID=A0A6P7FD20_DIAVI